jgi:hypothetical protein
MQCIPILKGLFLHPVYYPIREVSATSGPRFNTERKTIISSPAAAGDFDATEQQHGGVAQLSLREFDCNSLFTIKSFTVKRK